VVTPSNPQPVRFAFARKQKNRLRLYRTQQIHHRRRACAAHAEIDDRDIIRCRVWHRPVPALDGERATVLGSREGLVLAVLAMLTPK